MISSVVYSSINCYWRSLLIDLFSKQCDFLNHCRKTERFIFRNGSTCLGERSVSRLVTKTSPVLVLRVFELAMYGYLPLEILLQSTELSLECKTYKLAGITLHRGNHYCSIIASEQHGFLWYDGLDGVLQPLKNKKTSWTPSHAIYCLV
jgi:hypothetical protein